MPDRRSCTRTLLFAVIFLSSLGATQVRAEETAGTRLTSSAGVTVTTFAVMKRQAETPPHPPHPDHELEYPDRSNLPQTPNAQAIAS